MRYFAFITRDDRGRYVAVLPDFPGCVVRAGTLRAMAPAIRRTVRVAARGAGLPPRTLQPDLPRLPCELDGFWMQFDVGAVVDEAVEDAGTAMDADAA